MLDIKCVIIKISPEDEDVQGTLISISNGQGAVRVGNIIREFPLGRIILAAEPTATIHNPSINVDEEINIQNPSIEKTLIPLLDDEGILKEKIEAFIKENRPVIKPSLTSKLKGTDK